MEKVLAALLARLVSRGSLTVVSSSGSEFVFGDGTGEEVRARFLDPGAARAILINPELRLGELFMDGRLIMERGTIYDFLAVVLSGSSSQRKPLAIRLLDYIRFMKRRSISDNNPWRSRRNVAHHYDLDHRLYRLFLDKDFQYSCAYFEHPGQSLEEAQLAKKRLITSKLLVEPDSRVLDIGSGWGGLGLYIKQMGGAADVLGVTLSTEQLRVSRARAREQGVENSVRFALQDYRDVEGSFDRIVSVGMFEHVGPRFYGTYFRKCRELLKPDGVMLMHTIGLLDGPWYPNPWLDKYIFPGGQLPALSEIVPAIERAGLVVTDVECLRLHYAETLAEWRRRFMANRDDALALYDQRFCRMWEFYLAACEAAFRFQDVAVFQVQCARRQDAVPLTRDYIFERMHDLRMQEAQSGPGEAAFESLPRRKARQ
ncbi:MAG TPA: cyclopropane-fatty-acyl-phospholipid synthase family protein [Hyphomicrobium sp.]